MNPIHLRPLAEKDLHNIWLFFPKLGGEAQADQYFNQLSNAIELLGSAPLMCHLHQEFIPPVRIHHHGSHLIIYVVVIRVLHENMDIEALLE